MIDNDDEFVSRCVEGLKHRFDAVQILVSRVDETGNTQCCKKGIGNWYARTGMAREFLEEDRSQVENNTKEGN